jgi:hypothetical protein
MWTNLPTRTLGVGIVGTAGEQTGAVYKFTIGRTDLKVVEMGAPAPINARMGLNTWAAFTGTNEKDAIAGDVAMLESEVVPVLKALRKNGLDVVAIHHHMTNDRPFSDATLLLLLLRRRVEGRHDADFLGHEILLAITTRIDDDAEADLQVGGADRGLVALHPRAVGHPWLRVPCWSSPIQRRP